MREKNKTNNEEKAREIEKKLGLYAYPYLLGKNTERKKKEIRKKEIEGGRKKDYSVSEKIVGDR